MTGALQFFEGRVPILVGDVSTFGRGMSLLGGGQRGPGYCCRVPIASVGRQRKGDDRRGTFYLLSARR